MLNKKLYLQLQVNLPFFSPSSQYKSSHFDLHYEVDGIPLGECLGLLAIGGTVALGIRVATTTVWRRWWPGSNAELLTFLL